MRMIRERNEQLLTWLASIDPNIPLHISRFFPSFRMTHKSPTPVEKIHKLADVARANLKYVYKGNI